MGVRLIYIGAVAEVAPAASLQALPGDGAVLIPRDLPVALADVIAAACGRPPDGEVGTDDVPEVCVQAADGDLTVCIAGPGGPGAGPGPAGPGVGAAPSTSPPCRPPPCSTTASSARSSSRCAASPPSCGSNALGTASSVPWTSSPTASKRSTSSPRRSWTAAATTSTTSSATCCSRSTSWPGCSRRSRRATWAASRPRSSRSSSAVTSTSSATRSPSRQTTCAASGNASSATQRAAKGCSTTCPRPFRRYCWPARSSSGPRRSGSTGSTCSSAFPRSPRSTASSPRSCEGPLSVAGEERAGLSELEHRLRHEFGDLLFATVNVARKAGIDPEIALRAACDRFVRRVDAAVELAAREGTEWAGLSLAEQDDFYRRAKSGEGGLYSDHQEGTS